MELKVLVYKNPYNTDEPRIRAYVTFQSEVYPSEFNSEMDVRREETQIMYRYSLYGELARRIEDLTIEFFNEKMKKTLDL